MKAQDNGKIDYSKFLLDSTDQEIYRLDRSVFTDPEIFEKEMKYIFGKSWMYLCHESQIKNPNDFFTTYMGRQSVIITRDTDNNIGGYINACTHRGAQLINVSRGNKKIIMCPFHGWCFKSDGQLVDCGKKEGVGYSENFNPDELGLKKIAKIESYRGFVFGTLSNDAGSLKDYLREASKIIDMLVDQSDNGLEILPGVTTYTYNGNWKLQAENGVDGYHVESIHANYVQTVMNRKKIMAENDPVKSANIGDIKELPGGCYDLGSGHVMLWAEFPNPQDRPSYGRYEEFVKVYGKTRADWMVGFLRNLCLYPNVFIMDQMSTQIRHFRPISVDKTEVTTYCIAPVGESDDARLRRIRQYEDFFNATGMATPDDLSAFNHVQEGCNAENLRWSDMSRGAMNRIDGPESFAQEMGISPLSSGVKLEDETIMVTQHRHWVETMQNGEGSE